MPLFLVGGALVLGYFLFGNGGSTAAGGSRPAPALPPAAVGTVALTGPNGFMLLKPETTADLAALVALVGPLPTSAQGLSDIAILADPKGSFVAAYFGNVTPKGFAVRDLRLLKGATLEGILQNRAVQDAVLHWEDTGVLTFFSKNGYPLSLRALFGR